MINRFLCYLFAIVFFSQGAIANNVIKACGHHDYAPWNALHDDSIVGLCADIATELYSRIGYKVDHSYVGPWKRCQMLIENGAVDMNICSFKNINRAEYSVFMPSAIATNENALFIKANSTIDYQTLDDLNGLIIGKVRGVSLGDQVDDYLSQNAVVAVVEDYSKLFKMLLLGRVEAFIFSRESGKDYISKHNLQYKIIDLPKPIVIGKLHISLSKKSKHLSTIKDINNVFLSDDYQEWQAELFKKYKFSQFDMQ
ncbi:substrate-binding periplasmic protein [Paraglaciecola marina]|uniref:substrate-binding periplasmic protein n=1 Tax=Paraglaciecola marina TaxID=2500157 RepID=UPI00105E9BFC|nr:transporter substrate-binding domain-containing protein [Paraglaciecola marina]